MTSLEFPVLIVGAGPVGMSAAIELARWGVRSLSSNVIPRQLIIPKRAASLRGQWKYCDLGESSHRFAQTRYPRGHFASSGSKRLLGARLAELNRPGAMCLGRIVPRTFAWLPKTLLRPCFITRLSHIRRSSCD